MKTLTKGVQNSALYLSFAIVVVGTVENIHSLFLFLTWTHKGKQLRETETNCFSIHLIIELWF